MLYFGIHFNYLFKHCSSLMGHLKETKLTSANFPKKNSFKGKWVIYIQFGPKLQHPISHELPYSKDVFETLWHEGAQLDNRSIGQLSQKIPFSRKKTIWAQFCPKLLNLISHDQSQCCCFLEHFSMAGQNKLTKGALVSFPQKFTFKTIVQFRPNLGQNSTTLWTRQLCLLVHSLNILKYGMIGHNSQNKVILANLPNKFPF